MAELKWTEADQKAAEAEGWNVFHSSDRGLEIERVDAPEAGDQVLEPTFANDALAIGHVYFKAQEGSALHQKALTITLHGMKGFAHHQAPHVSADRLADVLRNALNRWSECSPLSSTERTEIEIGRDVLEAFDLQRAQQFAEPGHIGIRLEGGVVQSVFTDRPMDVIVIDYDTDGSDPDDVFDMPQDDGSTSECLVSEYPADVMPEECRRIREALDARDDAEHARGARP